MMGSGCPAAQVGALRRSLLVVLTPPAARAPRPDAPYASRLSFR